MFVVRHKHIFSDGKLDYIAPQVRHETTCENRTTVEILSGNRPMAPADRAELNKIVEEKLAQGIIEPSKAPWSSNMLLVRKDAERNKFTTRDAYPMPKIQDLMDHLKG